LLGAYPIPAIGRVFVSVGIPLGYLIVEATPDSFLHELAPQGGPDAVAWAFAIGALLTWFVLFFAVCFIAIGRMRSNSAAHPEPLKQRTLWHLSSRRPGGRER
jgi:hypothetical protein